MKCIAVLTDRMRQFNMYDVIIESTSGTIIYELDILYDLIKKGYVIKC